MPNTNVTIKQIDNTRWQIDKTGPMNTRGIIYADEEMIPIIKKDDSLTQVANVACLPGIVGPSMAMPDIHSGYGFPIGGVAAFDLDEGIVSPGGVGYDINCGVRLFKTALQKEDIRRDLKLLVDGLFLNIPSGLGSKRKDLTLNTKQLARVLENGAAWAVRNGFGSQSDLNHIEDSGKIENADPTLVSEKALKRGRPQLGTLGSGNHFVEIAFIDEIYDETSAAVLGLQKGMVTVSVHTGSRGLGYQVCDDFIRKMLKASRQYNITLPDRQLCCAPVRSKEGRNYLAAMACAANYAFANRQIIGHWVRETFEQVLQTNPRDLKMELIYDICHNIAKIEDHFVNGKQQKVCVHRKGATRAFPPNHSQIPVDYRSVGQPILIPGDMGRYSHLLVGTEKAMTETFGSTCHGAGRLMSRHQAKKAARGRAIYRELQDRGVIVTSAGKSTLAEEMPEAYKDVNRVVDIVARAGIARKVARMKPLGVVKG